MGHISRHCPLNKYRFKKKNRKFHGHVVEENESDEEKAREKEDSSEEYILILALAGSISHGSDTSLIDSGDSKNMIAHKYSLSCLIHKDYPHKVHLGNDYRYPIKGMGEASYKKKYGNSMKMN